MTREASPKAPGMVVDANVVAKWFLQEEHSGNARSVLESEAVLAAPDLLIPELGSIFREKVRSGELGDAEAASAIEVVLERVFLISSEEAFREALTIATSFEVSFYDAVYVALAGNLHVPLITADGRLVRALGNEFRDAIRPLWEYET